ncbi:MAG TPA: hypothetical protein VMR33_19315 [Candidatus Baltobacteraceae bacterium]|jgi:hypothetical protein|nr:hypothetical protein [Candidatus Baltobacteraceae bacterium]
MSKFQLDMTSARTPEELLFAAALVKPPDVRAAFLDGVCYGDPVLRQRLDALLAANDHGNDYDDDFDSNSVVGKIAWHFQ